MDMEKATLENFYAFIEDEALTDPDRPITQRRWSDCAVGDFAHEVLDITSEMIINNNLPKILFGEDTYLYDYLANETNYDLPLTYGELDLALNYIEDHGEMDDGFIS